MCRWMCASLQLTPVKHYLLAFYSRTGQKQLLGVARALVRRPLLLLMDEATSNVDATTGESFVP